MSDNAYTLYPDNKDRATVKAPYLPHASPFSLNEWKHRYQHLSAEEQEKKRIELAARLEDSQKEFEQYRRARGSFQTFETRTGGQSPLAVGLPERRSSELIYDGIRPIKALG